MDGRDLGQVSSIFLFIFASILIVLLFLVLSSLSLGAVEKGIMLMAIVALAGALISVSL